ncbi:hypothetical protein KKG90_06265 [Candidatus Bipolaricaulota bacterium]|nr:hypothetical protein [Candidatus Bipolaricaulota bacterium]
MNKTRTFIIGLTVASLLAVGVVAVAGNGFGTTANWQPQQAVAGTCNLHEHDADGDGILNSEDADWVRPMDGSGYGVRQGLGRNLSGDRPMDGTGFGTRQGGGLHDGSCL